jgi:hypothetical protein
LGTGELSPKVNKSKRDGQDIFLPNLQSQKSNH